MWMLFSCSPASITLSGDTLEKKEGFQTTQFLHYHKNKQLLDYPSIFLGGQSICTVDQS